MYYYDVMVASTEYHGKKALSYSYSEELLPGTIIKIPLKDKFVLGLVIAKLDKKPTVPLKEISEVAQLPRLPQQLIDLYQWMLTYYPASPGATLQLFLPSYISFVSPVQEKSKPAPYSARETLPLTAEQKQILAQMNSYKASTYLLHGDTGSGKTRVYIELIKKVLERGASALVLTPEIGLTPQMAQQFTDVFGEEKVIIMHSGLKTTERRKAWNAILQRSPKEPLIVLGARSALFSPVANIGLIVVDEEHDSSYKQEQTPYYHAVRVAATLARLHAANLILGSATPSVADYYLAQQKKIPILRMQTLATTNKPASITVDIVSIRNRDNYKRSPSMSERLLKSVEASLARKQQALVFLNRRGTARLVMCRTCGWQALCPRCDLPLTFHADRHILQCHTCGFIQPPLTSCPDCAATEILFHTPGTKAVAEELHKLFPDASIARFDSDNLALERLDKRYASLADGTIDIIVGTQMLVKGFDIPKLAVVGIISADSSLAFPDFSTEENTHQLISQVIGRVGRGHVPGEVIIQTNWPDSPIIQSAIQKNWEQFLKKELSERERFGFPPFRHVLKLQCARASRASAQAAAKKLKDSLQHQYAGKVTILGPAPSFYEKIQHKYRWQLIIKTSRRSVLLDIVQNLPSGWKYDIDPLHLL